MIKNLWKDPVWSKVIAAGILAALAYLGAYLLGVLPFIKEFFIQVWEFISASTFMPNWLIGLMTIPCVLIVWALLLELKHRVIGDSSAQLDWKSYQRGNFFGLLWVWHYSGNRIDGLHSLCPKCEYQIIPHDVSSYAAVPRFESVCDDCGYSAGSFEGSPIELLKKVELKIQKEVRTGNWAQKTNA